MPELDTSVFVIPQKLCEERPGPLCGPEPDRQSVIEELSRRARRVCVHARRAAGSPRSTTRVGRRRAAARQSAMRRSLGDHVRQGFGPSGCTISNTRMAIGLRVVGVGFEDRKLLLGHKSDHVTTHYSAPEIGALIEASEKVCELGSRKSPALAIVRARAATASDLIYWWLGWDSNPRPRHYECHALTS